MTIVGTTMGISAWLAASIALARNASVPLERVQARVDSMTDPLSESGHRLAWDASLTALQINMYRSLRRPLPIWTPEQAKDPEGTLREFAAKVFQQVAEDEVALLALQKSGELFVDDSPTGEDNISRPALSISPLARDTLGKLLCDELWIEKRGGRTVVILGDREIGEGVDPKSSDAGESLCKLVDQARQEGSSEIPLIEYIPRPEDLEPAE